MFESFNLSHFTISEKKAFIYSSVALIIMMIGSIGIDQITKKVAEDNLMTWSHEEDLKLYQGKRSLVYEFGNLEKSATLIHENQIPDFYLVFSFNYVRNQGAAWGLFSDWDDRVRIPFFYLITLLAVAVIFMYWHTTPIEHRLARYTLALILSGALGNFTDRILRGYVVDFLDFRWIIPLPFRIKIGDSINWTYWQYSFPNFNWADSVISVGVFLLAIDMFILERIRNKKSQNF